MVDDNFVAAIGAKRGLYCLRDRTACFDIANDGAIFGLVAAGQYQSSSPKDGL